MTRSTGELVSELKVPPTHLQISGQTYRMVKEDSVENIFTSRIVILFDCRRLQK